MHSTLIFNYYINTLLSSAIVNFLFVICVLGLDKNKNLVYVGKKRYESESVYASESDFGWIIVSQGLPRPYVADGWCQKTS